MGIMERFGFNPEASKDATKLGSVAEYQSNKGSESIIDDAGSDLAKMQEQSETFKNLSEIL